MDESNAYRGTLQIRVLIYAALLLFCLLWFLLELKTGWRIGGHGVYPISAPRSWSAAWSALAEPEYFMSHLGIVLLICGAMELWARVGTARWAYGAEDEVVLAPASRRISKFLMVALLVFLGLILVAAYVVKRGAASPKLFAVVCGLFATTLVARELITGVSRSRFFAVSRAREPRHYWIAMGFWLLVLAAFWTAVALAA